MQPLLDIGFFILLWCYFSIAPWEPKSTKFEKICVGFIFALIVLALHLSVQDLIARITVIEQTLEIAQEV